MDKIIENIDRIVNTLNLQNTKIKRNAKGQNELWALCPFHPDKNPSYSINLETGVSYCFGCNHQGNIVKDYAKINGIDDKQALKEIYKLIGAESKPKEKVGERVHIYKDFNGKPLYRKIIRKYNDESKTATFERFENDKWKTGLNGLIQIPYNIEALSNLTVFISESEKDIDKLKELSLSGLASGGASNAKVFEKFLNYFENKQVIILPHNDTAGIKFAEQVAKMLYEKAKSIKVIDPKIWGNVKGADVADWLTEGHTKEELLNLVENTEVYKPKTERGSGKPNASDILLKIIDDGVENYFVDDKDEVYAITDIGYHPVNSKSFKNYTAKRFYDATGKGFNNDIWKNALITVEAQGRYGSKNIGTKKLHNRIAKVENTIYYWLKNGKAVEITPNGWNIVDEPVLFRKYSHQLSQVEPDKNADIKDVFKILNFTSVKNDDEQILLLIWLIAGFIPDIPRTILILTGEQGAGKTTFLEKIKSLIDPSTVSVMSKPPTEIETVQLLDHHYFINFDNLKTITSSFSDLLCKAVTGFGIAKRKLFSDDEDITYNFKRLIALNGITTIATAPDVLDRSILIKASRFEKNKPLQILNREFEKVKPKILGAIFHALSKALKIYQEKEQDFLNMELPRMADWTIYGWCIAEACGIGRDRFLNAYYSNIGKQNQEAIENDTVGQVLIEFMRDRDSWSGFASELFKELKDVAERIEINTNGKFFASTPNALTRRINKLKTNLKTVGINFETKHTEHGTLIFIKTISSVASDRQDRLKMASGQDFKADGIANAYRQESSGYRQDINSGFMADDKYHQADDKEINTVRGFLALGRETDDTDYTDDIDYEVF